MGKEILTFGDITIKKKRKFIAMRLQFFKEWDIEKVLVSNKTSVGEKNYKKFISYVYNDNKIKPLHVMLPKTIAYLKSHNGQNK